MPKHIEVHKLSGTSGDVCLVRLLDKKLNNPLVIQETVGELAALVDEGHTKLAISFANVEVLMSAFLNSLLKLRQRLDENSGAIRICDLSPPVRDAFTVPKLDRVFVIKATQKDALADF